MLNGTRRLEKMNGSEVGIVADRWIGVLRSLVCVTGGHQSCVAVADRWIGVLQSLVCVIGGHQSCVAVAV